MIKHSRNSESSSLLWEWARTGEGAGRRQRRIGIRSSLKTHDGHLALRVLLLEFDQLVEQVGHLVKSNK